MKKLIVLLAAVLIGAPWAHAQRFAFVDVEYILGNLPEYQQSQKKLDEISAQWQKEIEMKYKEIDDLYKSYQAEQVLLTEDMRRKREDDILNREKAVKDLQKQKFGYQGELFKKRQEFIKPIQDKIYDAIEKMCKEKKYDFIFDKSAGSFMLYTNAVHDRSDDIIRALGYTPGKVKTE